MPFDLMHTGTLIDKQNADGGWPYTGGGSWTEPTVYAILALLAAGEPGPAGRGLNWIRANIRADGGWPSKPGVDQSSWATGVVALLPREKLGEAPHSRAIAWLLGTTGEESTFLYRVREWMLGVNALPESESPGWPWTPGAAAWVGPTAIAIVALEKELQRRTLAGAPPLPKASRRIGQGRAFLLNRMCHEGGWNHGSARALGYEGNAYPETTGMALAALRGVRTPKVEVALAVAERFLKESNSADAQNWLRLGLRVHGSLPERYCPAMEVKFRTVPEIALNLVCGAAADGRNWFGAAEDRRG